MGRCVDLEAGGGRFDSRRAQVTFFGHVGRVCSLIFTYVGTCLGTLFGRDGDTQNNVFFTIGPQNGDLGALLPPN